MRSAIIYGTYTVLNIIALFLVDHWLCRASEKHQNSVAGRVIVDFLYIVLAFIPILATIIKDSIYKYFLLRYSYIWMGFLMYFGGMLLFATVGEVIVRCVKRAKQKKREKEGYSPSEEEIEKSSLFEGIDKTKLFEAIDKVYQDFRNGNEIFRVEDTTGGVYNELTREEKVEIPVRKLAGLFINEVQTIHITRNRLAIAVFELISFFTAVKSF